MEQAVKDLLFLTGCALRHKTPDQAVVHTMDLDALYKIARRQKMTSILSSALQSAGVQDRRFIMSRMANLSRNRTMDQDRKKIFLKMDEAGIWHMPLKGLVLRDYYPQPDLREMSDNDILFDASRAADVKEIMESLGFKTVHFGIDHQDDYQKEPVSHFEMHRLLFTTSAPPRVFEYYQKINERLLPKSKFQRRFTNEDFYLYMIMHEYKHYYWEGIGVRALADTYAFLRKSSPSLDWPYIRRELGRLGIADFEKRNRKLAGKVFSPDGLNKLSAEEERMLGVFTSGGVFGRADNTFNSIRMMELGKTRYFMESVFPPMSQVREFFPLFYRHKILLPFLPLYRVVQGREKFLSRIRDLL